MNKYEYNVKYEFICWLHDTMEDAHLDYANIKYIIPYTNVIITAIQGDDTSRQIEFGKFRRVLNNDSKIDFTLSINKPSASYKRIFNNILSSTHIAFLDDRYDVKITIEVPFNLRKK